MKVTIRQVKGGSGIDVWAESLCRGLRKEGHICDVDLCSGIYQIIPLRPGFPKIKNDSDIIQGNSWNGLVFSQTVPLVVTEHLVVHDPQFAPYKSIAQKAYHRWIYQCEKKTLDAADAVTCVSHYSRKQLESTFEYTSANVIYNGIDTSIFHPTHPAGIPNSKKKCPIVLFYAGNLSKRKGSDLLPAIMKRLGERFQLNIASGYTKSTAFKMKNIQNLGYLSVSQLVEAYNHCDIFLSPTRLEGFGLSVAEAMACGKPVVATNGSSLPELVVDGKGGFLCEMDNTAAFAERIRYLAEEPSEREKIGRFNQDRVKELFSLDDMVKKYVRLYKSLI